MSTTYSLNFQNNSSNKGEVCVYQSDPNIGVPNVMSLAWFTKTTYPTTRVTFNWTIDYSFVWSETGELVPGVMFNASQVWPANLSGNNKVTFEHQGGAYTFSNQTSGPAQGNLYIAEDKSIPLKIASVGIGMSGKGTFAVQAQPNYNLIFTPHPKYWITFGNFCEGEVLDITQITHKNEIAFPPGVYSMTAILGQDNTWTIKPTSAVNKAFIDAKARQDSMIKWGVV